MHVESMEKIELEKTQRDTAATEARARAQKLATEAEKQFRRKVVVLRKQTLCEAIENGNMAVLNWCHKRAIEKFAEPHIENVIVYGTVMTQITEQDAEIIQRRMWRWYHRICTWWEIDPGYGEPN